MKLSRADMDEAVLRLDWLKDCVERGDMAAFWRDLDTYTATDKKIILLTLIFDYLAATGRPALSS